jgi:hypothetical protein
VLLSFAQFEREVTGERIRDKIAASKKRGMWMGGFVPVGYLKRDRALAIDDQEAKTVRLIFKRYTELKSVHLLKQDLDRRGMVSKIRIGKNGLKMGGKAYSRGKLYKLLSNPIYKGEIRHLKTCYPGQHPAIIDHDLWEKSRELLNRHNVRGAGESGRASISPLAGRLFDQSGVPLAASHCVKKGRRHRYYVSRRLLTERPDSRADGGWRLPATEIERSVPLAAAAILEDKPALVTAINQRGMESERITAFLERAADWIEKSDLTPPDKPWGSLSSE